MKNFGTQVTGLNPKMLGLGGAIAAVGIGIIKATKDTIDLGSSLVDLQSKTGLSIQELQELKFAAEQSGTGFKQVQDAVLRLGRRTAAELPETTKFLQKLGLSVDDVLAKNPGEGFALIAEKIRQIPSPAQQAAAAMGIFGDAGLQVLPLINQGVQENIERFRELGVAMSDETAVAAKKLSDDLTDLSAQWTAIKTTIGAVVIPALNNILKFFSDLLSAAIQGSMAFVGRFFANLVEKQAKGAAALALFNDSFVAISDTLFNSASDLRAWADEQERLARLNLVSANSGKESAKAIREQAAATGSAFGMMRNLNLQIGQVPENLNLMGQSLEEANEGLRQHRDNLALAENRLRTTTMAETTLGQRGSAAAKIIALAHKNMEEARREDSALTSSFMNSNNIELVGNALGALANLGSKFKAAAIAQAIIATYLAIANAFKFYVWPMSLVAAAAAAAAGFANVARIRSAKAFQQGTGNLDFENFGPETSVNLHGREAVIPQGRGHQLAGEIASALGPGGSAGGSGGMVVNNTFKITGAIVGTAAELEAIVSEATIRGIRDNPRLRDEIDKRAVKATQ